MLNQTEQVSYDIIGTLASPATLTDDITDNSRVLDCRKMTKLTLDFIYTPLLGETNRLAYIVVEVSTDEGVTYVPIALDEKIPGQIKAHVENSVVTDGNPIVIPGDGTSTGDVPYKGQLTLNIYGDHVKVSARESGSADFGTLGVRATLSS